MPLDPTVSTLIGTAIGAFAGISGTVLSTYFIQRAEERRQTRRLIMEMALENWKYLREMADRLAAQRGSAEVPPIDTSVVHMTKLLEVCTHKRLTESEARRIICEVNAVTTAATKQIQENDEASRKK